MLLYRKHTAQARTDKKKALPAFERWYENSLKWVLRHQRAVWLIFFGMASAAVLLFFSLDKSTLPPAKHDDALLAIDWNAPLSLAENDTRAVALIGELPAGLAEQLEEWTLLAGRQDFLLRHSGDIDADGANIYLKARDPKALQRLQEHLSETLKRKWPEAGFSFSEAANPFNLVFAGDSPQLTARLRSRGGGNPDPDHLNALIDRIRAECPDLSLEPVSWREHIMLVADTEKMALYGLDFQTVHTALSRATHERTLFSIRSGSSPMAVIVADAQGSGDTDLRTADLLSLQVNGRDGTSVPLSYILSEHRKRDLSSVVSGREGGFYPLNIEASGRDIPSLVRSIDRVVRRSGDFDVSYAGSWYESRSMMRELALVLIVSLLLLFFILAAQFESLVQPLIILAEVLVDIFGALLALRIAGAGINLMSLIGIVVMAGIVINDSILKVDTINRLRRSGASLLRAILLGGRRRLRPILMTSLTTIGAVAPLLIRGSMGADLQFPLSVALIGGLAVGTLVSLLFVPLFYHEIYRKRDTKAL